jgi:hypothetical protein
VHDSSLAGSTEPQLQLGHQHPWQVPLDRISLCRKLWAVNKAEAVKTCLHGLVVDEFVRNVVVNTNKIFATLSLFVVRDK